jgi:microsomal dipeptidase-like Zn-dependent dipeptidase
VAHVQHVCTLMGHRRGVGLGSDMDGGFSAEDLPADLQAPSDLARLTAALRAVEWSTEELKDFAAGNWLRFLQRVLPTRESD